MQQEYSRGNPLISFRADDSFRPVGAEPSILAEYLWFPFYDFVVTLIPRWISPNYVTLFGISCTLTSSLLLLSSMPKETLFEPPRAALLPTFAAKVENSPLGPLYPTVMEPVLSFFTPTTLLVLCGMLNLMYCIADNTDGRLARLCKRSSVVGEYLDHSLDCVTSLLSTGVVFSVMGASTANMALSVSSIALATVLAHTLHYETKRFVWGNRIMSVDEAMLFFAVGIWIPLLLPNVAFFKMPIPASVVKSIPYLEGFRLIDFLYYIMFVSQGSTAVGLCWNRPGMAVRCQTLALVVTAAILMVFIPKHCAVASAAGAEASASWSKIFQTYNIGPLSYVAVWTITTACSFSSIIHMPIVAHCAKRPFVDYLPLSAVLGTLLLFPSSPVVAMIWSVVTHVMQILSNIQLLYQSHYEEEDRKRLLRK